MLASLLFAILTTEETPLPTFEQARASCFAEHALPRERVAGCSQILQAATLEDRIRARALFRRGGAYVALRDFRAAIADYSATLEVNPDMSEARLNRAIAYRAARQYDRAIADYDVLIAASPREARLYNNRGNAHRDAGHAEQALADFTEATRLNPLSPLAFFNRGALFMQLGRDREAVAEFDHALTLDPQYAQARSARAQLVGR